MVTWKSPLLAKAFFLSADPKADLTTKKVTPKSAKEAITTAAIPKDWAVLAVDWPPEDEAFSEDVEVDDDPAVTGLRIINMGAG